MQWLQQLTDEVKSLAFSIFASPKSPVYEEQYQITNYKIDKHINIIDLDKINKATSLGIYQA